MTQTAPNLSGDGSGDEPAGEPLKVGDNVVYPTQGAGVIVGQVERTIGGQVQQYLEIELMKGGMRVMVPLGQSERVGLRRITPEEQVPELLGGLAEPDLELPAGWTPRHRKEQTLLAEGDIFKVARLVGTLTRRDQERALSVTERRILDDARHMLVTEVAVSLGIPLPEADAMIDAKLES